MTHPAPVVRAAVDVLDDWLEHHLTPQGLTDLADAVLDAVEAARTRPVVDRLGDVVDAVERVLYRAGTDSHPRDVATEVACVLLGDAYATRNDDGTATLVWPDDRARAALVSRELLELLVADANRVRAGSEPYPNQAVELTAGQWWGMLLDLEPDTRRKALEDFRAAASNGNWCWSLQHADRLDRLETRNRDLEAENDTLRRTLAALRGPLAPLVDRTPTLQADPDLLDNREGDRTALRDAVRAVEVRPTPTTVLPLPEVSP